VLFSPAAGQKKRPVKLKRNFGLKIGQSDQKRNYAILA
jgi:hypothetical protein